MGDDAFQLCSLCFMENMKILVVLFDLPANQSDQTIFDLCWIGCAE